MQHLEQMDIFAFMEEIEKREAESRAIEAAAVEEVEPVVFTRQSLFSRFKAGLQWFLGGLPILFGLAPWVNVYTVTRAFGGREEGGWYYRKFTCEVSRQVWIWEADALQLKFIRRYSELAWGVISSETVGQEVEVLIERRKAAQQSSVRPPHDPERVVGSLPEDYVSPATPPKPAAVPKSKVVAFKPRTKQAPPGQPVVPASPISTGPKKVINKILVMTGFKKEPCERCSGTGQTRFTHVKNGICFKCNGEGSIEKKSS